MSIRLDNVYSTGIGRTDGRICHNNVARLRAFANINVAVP